MPGEYAEQGSENISSVDGNNIWKITQVERSVMHGKKEVKTSAAAEQTVIRRAVSVDVEEESRTLIEPALWTKLSILAFS